MTPTLDTSALDLGKDRERISRSDAARQTATVNHLLNAFCGPASERREVQLLADEVGMGKTFVALAAAYTVLSMLRDATTPRGMDDLSGCYRCVLVITPGGNPTLADKWDREDEAMLTRCAIQPKKVAWFKSILCRTSDELLQGVFRADDLRRKAPVVLVTQASVFTKRLSDPAVRFVTACLFRWWGVGLPKEKRYHIVRGLSETSGSGGWDEAAMWTGRGEYEIELWDWARHEEFLRASDRDRDDWDDRSERRRFAAVSVTYEQMSIALDHFDRADNKAQLEELRQTCCTVPSRRPGDQRTSGYAAYRDWFYELKDGIRDIFKQLWHYLLGGKFPLVITDEAHHWRNNEAGDFKAIREYVAPFAKRMLLLTATPFQLNPQETVSVLNVIDHMGPAIGVGRMQALQKMRTTLADRMSASEIAGKSFSREWGSLADQMARLADCSNRNLSPVPGEDDSRTAELHQLWANLGDGDAGAAQVSETVPGLLRPFFNRALELRRANRALCDAMRPLIVRHRRSSNHRRYWVGEEYPEASDSLSRPDRNRIHLAPGQPLEARDELVQYLLMKVVAAANRGRHRTALGAAVTGCYSTLWESNEGRRAVDAAAAVEQGGLFKLLQRLTGTGLRTRDAEHPKLRRVVDAVIDRWDRGEKSLIFCFRIPTATALQTHLSRAVERQLHKKRAALLKARGTEAEDDEERDKAMQQFRRSLTAREGSGVQLFLDRVLIGWLSRIAWEVPTLTEEDIKAVAALAARATLNGKPLFPDFKRPDRVFLHRAVEHVWANRLRLQPQPEHLTPKEREFSRDLLNAIATDSWICERYGERRLSAGGDADSAAGERAARSSLAARFQLKTQTDPAHLDALEQELLARFRSGRESVLSVLATGPNLFGPYGASLDGLPNPHMAKPTATQLRDSLFDATLREDRWDWEARRAAVDAVIRAILRDDVLLRMPTSVFKDHDDTWAESLFHGMHRGTGPHTETLAQRVVAFLRELGRMSEKERSSYLEYATNPRAEAVVLVTGGTKSQSRDAIFCGFNTPLLPEILVCTAVGQEGIDLHRECRHVIHYDLGWNPATIEQRTGRTDRIGSKAERERKFTLAEGEETAAAESRLPGLDVALPYLAATYDERMFDVLRTRAQVFEILTGGDPTADRDAEAPWLDSDQEGADSGVTFVPLPQRMLEDLRVELGVR